MPTYLYQHTVKNQMEGPCELGEEFETEQSINDDALKFCTECNMPVKRLIAGGVSVKWGGQGPPTPRFHG
jgi:predicted nucleic acid-binding Zn ribbon protein